MPSSRLCPKTIEDLKGIFNLRDWNIRYNVSRSKNSDCYGCVLPEIEYKKATITIYPEVIRRRGNGETVFRVLVHEFAEIVVAEHLGCISKKRQDSDEMMAYRDRLADHIMRIVLPLLRELSYPV